VQLNDAVRKLLFPKRAERHRAMPRCKEWNAFTDEGWHDGDDEFVNRVLIQERPDDLASALLGAQLPSAGSYTFHIRLNDAQKLRAAWRPPCRSGICV
jgi:hypothetical protein